ncbi:MAG: hypothetical protein COU07_03350 [Candidatus Harrisonbacteria bacterium CG10_big_fil_rev_8_21_14_0_10_40_38]|uniref:Uncharacterized protein n=1 Tax=Candidatus Harrisonbacteria bacterium CG10_big_fil_rev_8_21_14_0_10_40_38 TaxID=1974583 RepID=A0A2H0UR95_9BACT|nr:MAG: hypothetical protein COU07_03350 [Candidatus Harrisonbacteria bacterium CG10_big_fil_rev_8_21_14_0_10_40_38]
MKKIQIIIFGAVAVAVLGGVFFFTSSNGIGGGTLPKYKGDAIENIGTDLFIAEIPKDVQEKYKNELSDLNEGLKNTPDNIDLWIQVGIIKKIFNNYNGARDAWEYAKIVNPKHSTPYYNLGGLYGSYIKDFEKAEENYLKAIEIDPTLGYLYLGLADFYENFYTEKADQAIEVIKQGLVVVPDEPSLKQALEHYENLEK